MKYEGEGRAFTEHAGSDAVIDAVLTCPFGFSKSGILMEILSQQHMLEMLILIIQEVSRYPKATQTTNYFVTRVRIPWIHQYSTVYQLRGLEIGSLLMVTGSV